MKMKQKFAVLSAVAALSLCQASAQTLVLSGTNYFENFDTLSAGLPNGWQVRTGATAAGLGTLVGFTSTHKDWSNTTGSFANYASTTNNDGTAFVGNETPTIQTNALNRSAGVRQTGSFGDPGAAFVLRIDNTVGFGMFQASLDFQNLNPQGRTIIWTLDYAVGNTPSAFFSLGTYTNYGTNTVLGVFGKTNLSFSFGNALDNQTENVWIRVAALNASTGSQSRSTFGIDNFSLGFTNIPFVAQPVNITTQPQSRTNFAGTTATFSVAVSGTAPFSYQWKKEGADIFDGTTASGSVVSGANTGILSISSVRTNDAGNYSVSVSNSVNSTTSQSALLTVINPTPIVTNIAFLRTKMDAVDYSPNDTTNLYTAEGIVTTPINLTGANDAQFYLQDSTAGIAVFVSGGSTIRPSQGDRVKVTGPLGHFNGLFELNLVAANFTHSVETLSSGNALPVPAVFNFSTLTNIPVMEASVEGSLLVISNVFLQAGGVSNFVSGGNYNMTNSAGQICQLRIDTRVLDVIGKPIPSFVTSVKGVMGQFDSSAPFTSGYQFFLTKYSDLSGVVPIIFAINRSGSSVEITWPTNSVGFTLESTPTLTSPTWSPVGGATVSGSNNVVTVSNPTGNEFFRLRQ
ncbi:MAG: immunoglobulin domain-containing protein [Verrucomicrobiota bacterium]